MKRKLLVILSVTSLLLVACNKDTQEKEESGDLSQVQSEDVRKEMNSGPQETTNNKGRYKEQEKNLDKKKNLDSIVGLVVEVNEASNMITLKSRDRKAIENIISSSEVKGDKDFKFYSGDLVRLYYEKSFGDPRSFKIIDLRYAELIGDGEDAKVNYYKYPLLSVLKDGNIINLSKKNSAVTHDIINEFSWTIEEVEGFSPDYEVMDEVETLVKFDSSTGVLHDEKNGIWITLGEDIRRILKSSLDGKDPFSSF